MFWESDWRKFDNGLKVLNNKGLKRFKDGLD
jgi:hypothetical protein